MPTINLDTHQKLTDFKAALNRALNTWDDRPQWLMDLSDELETLMDSRGSTKPKCDGTHGNHTNEGHAGNCKCSMCRPTEGAKV